MIVCVFEREIDVMHVISVHLVLSVSEHFIVCAFDLFIRLTQLDLVG